MTVQPTPRVVRVLGAWFGRADAGLVRGAAANAALAVVDEQRRRQEWRTDEASALRPAVPLARRTA